MKDSLPSEASVLAFLTDQPDFFERHPALLLKLQLSHSPGGASSLLERQIKVLRERHRALESQVAELLANAGHNEQLFGHCQRVALAMLAELKLEPMRLQKLLLAVEQTLLDGFGLDAAQILPDAQRFPTLERRLLSADARAMSLTDELSRGVWCGTPTVAERRFLFGPDSDALQSAATVALGRNGELGLLALGSHDPERFRAGMGTLFLEFVGKLLGAALSRD